MPRRIAFLLALPLVLSGCGSNSGKAPSSGSISGNWQMSLQKDGSTNAPRSQAGFLIQNSDVVTGGMMLTDIPCSGVGSVSGTVSGSAVSLTLNPTGVVVNLSGIIGSDQASMSGNYTILSTGCSGSQSAPINGTWTADLVAPVTGTAQGSITSKPHGTTFSLTGQLSQGANTGDSISSITGNLSFTGYCYTTATVLGSISGTSVALDLVNTDGTEIGQITGTASLDGTSLTGTYSVRGQGAGASQDCVDGDSGTVTLTL
jgi:hypothetical protein